MIQYPHPLLPGSICEKQKEVLTSEFGVNFYWSSTVAFVGSWYTTSPVGRPGEIKRLSNEEVKAFIAEAMERSPDDTNPLKIDIDKHKTWKKYGRRGIYVPNAIFEAMKLIAFLEGRKQGTFLIAARSKTQFVEIHKAFGAYCKNYTPKYGKATATLMRKLMVTEVEEDEDQKKSKAISASLNAQSRRTAQKVYTLRKTKIQARQGKAMAEALFGAEPEWPEWKPSGPELEERLQRIANMYKRKSVAAEHEREEGADEEAPSQENQASSAEPRGLEADARTEADCGQSAGSQDDEMDNEDDDEDDSPMKDVPEIASEDSPTQESLEPQPNYEDLLMRVLAKHGEKGAEKLATMKDNFVAKGEKIPRDVIESVLEKWKQMRTDPAVQDPAGGPGDIADAEARASDTRPPPRRAPPRISAPKTMSHPVTSFFSQDFKGKGAGGKSTGNNGAGGKGGKKGEIIPKSALAKAAGATQIAAPKTMSHPVTSFFSQDFKGKGVGGKSAGPVNGAREKGGKKGDTIPKSAAAKAAGAMGGKDGGHVAETDLGKNAGGKDRRKGRPAALNDYEVEWVIEWRNRWHGVAGPTSVPNLVLRDMLDEGIAQNKLRSELTCERLRHVCRTHD